MTVSSRPRRPASTAAVVIGSAFLASVWAHNAQADTGPYGETMYLRGEMNGWGLVNPMDYLGTDAEGHHVYEVTVDLAVGYIAFKIANEHWNLNFAADGQQRTEIPLNQKTVLEDAQGSNNESILPVDNLSGFKFTLFVDAGNLGNPSLLIERAALQGPPPEPLPADPAASLTWRGQTAAITIDQIGSDTRTYTHHTTVALRDNLPPERKRVYSEEAGQMTLRSGSLMFDALFALALEETRQLKVDAITDGSFNNNQPVPCECFETGAKWHYVWTRDTAYATSLAMGLVDPTRAKNSLLFKLSERRVDPATQVVDGPEIVQDTGSGGSWPISTDRVTWAQGAWEVLKYLHGDERASFLAEAYAAIVTTIENDRNAIYDPVDGLYRGEQSYLDWREQTYPRWTASEVVHIGMSKALSTNVAHYLILDIASRLAEEQGDQLASGKYREWADDLKAAINEAFWLEDKGLYSTLKTTELDGAAVHMYDLLGESLAITSGVANARQARSITANYPRSEAGTPVIFPQLPNIPIYHNRGIWPFATAFGLRAAKLAKNDAVVAHDAESLARLAALNLSNMENFEYLTGRHTKLDGSNTGPVINSQRQLWSVAGYLSMVVDVLVGLEATQEGIRFQPFIPRSLGSTLFGESDTLVLKNIPYKGRLLTVELKLPGSQGKGGAHHEVRGYYEAKNIKLNGRSIRDGWISEADLQDSGNHLAIFLAPGRPSHSSLNLLRVADPESPTKRKVRALSAPLEPEVSSIQARRDGRLKLTIDPKGERRVVSNIYRNGELYAAGVQGDRWTDPEPGIAWSTGQVFRFSAGEDLMAGDGRSATDEHGRPHFADWGYPGEELTTIELEARESGKHYVQAVYGNALNSINTGITAANKWVTVEYADSGAPAGAGLVTMPHRSSWGDWGDSSLLPVSLTAGVRYRIRISDYYNMSYFEHFSIYNGAGGMGGPVNRANIAEVKVLPPSLHCYAVESEYVDTGNRSQHSQPQCYLPAL